MTDPDPNAPPPAPPSIKDALLAQFEAIMSKRTAVDAAHAEEIAAATALSNAEATARATVAAAIAQAQETANKAAAAAAELRSDLDATCEAFKLAITKLEA